MLSPLAIAGGGLRNLIMRTKSSTHQSVYQIVTDRIINLFFDRLDIVLPQDILLSINKSQSHKL